MLDSRPIVAERGEEMAAVLATGGILSHHTAADLWGIRPHHGAIHITVTGPARRSRPGLAIHRSLSLNAAVHDGLPLTTPTRRATGHAQRGRAPTARPHQPPWPETNVYVDGFLYHSTRQAFERDRARDAALQAAGYRVVRFTWRQITHEPHAVVAQLARLIG